MPKLSKSAQILRAKKLLEDFTKAGGSRKKMAQMRNTSTQNISREFRKPYVEEFIQKTISTHLEEAGITDPFLAKKLRKLMDAKKHVGMFGTKVVDDLPLQHQVVRTALEVKKHLKGAESTPAGGNHLHLTLDLRGENTGDKIREFTNRLSQANRG